MSDHGYFWVERFEGDKPSIGYRSKNGKWSFMGPYQEWTKMVRKTGYTHPAKIIARVVEYDMSVSLQKFYQGTDT